MNNSKPPRQVVLIMTDSQGTNVLSCYGSSLPTPNLDRLAAQGARFERAYTTSPVCSPARGAIFTGIYPHANGCWGNNMPLGDGVATVGQRVTDHGVRAAYVGKWHLDAFDYFGTGRCPSGWEESYWYDMRLFLEELPDDERRRSRQWGEDPTHPTRSENTFAHRCTDRGIRFLEDAADEDFLLVVSYDEPHGPHRCPPEYRERYRDVLFPANANIYDDLQDKPEHHKAWAAWLPHHEIKPEGFGSRDYFGCNAFVDDQIGRLLDAIDQHAPDAMVIFTSDHGYLLHAHQLYGKGPAMYDEAARIPLIIRWPGHIEPQTVLASAATHIDLTPTILDVFGIDRPPILNGRSLIPCLTTAQDEPRTIFMEFNRFSASGTEMGGLLPIRCACDGRYKLVINLFYDDELYDLHADPGELHNRINDPDMAHHRDRLHEQILQWMADSRDPFACWMWESRPWSAPRRPNWWAGDGRGSAQPVPDGYRPQPLDYKTGLP